jgi:hypothetical protein
MGKLTAILLLFVVLTGISAQPKIGINGSVEWDTMQINAVVSLDMASAGLRLPAGRMQGESALNTSFQNLILPSLLGVQFDSSSTIGDLINRGEFNLAQADAIVLGADSIPPALSPNMRLLTSAYTVSLSNIKSAFFRHSRPSPITRTLIPVTAAHFTGVVIIAIESLPIHGMRSTALAVPCLFPKIWDSEMNLIYERTMLEPGNVNMVRYAPPHSIFQNNPTGLSADLRQVVGDRPLRIFARGVFGINPTDLIIDRSDALLIISSEENRRLLREGRVAIILDESVLRYEFSGE